MPESRKEQRQKKKAARKQAQGGDTQGQNQATPVAEAGEATTATLPRAGTEEVFPSRELALRHRPDNTTSRLENHQDQPAQPGHAAQGQANLHQQEVQGQDSELHQVATTHYQQAPLGSHKVSQSDQSSGQTAHRHDRQSPHKSDSNGQPEPALPEPIGPPQESPRPLIEASDSQMKLDREEEYIKENSILWKKPPAPGTAGSKQPLSTNHFFLGIEKLQKIYVYHVDVRADDQLQKERTDRDGDRTRTPRDPRGQQRRRLIWSLFNEHRATFGQASTDYTDKICSLQQLETKQPTGGWKVRSQVPGQQMPTNRAPKDYRVTVALTNHYNLQDFKDYLTSDQKPPRVSYNAEIVAALNLFISRFPQQRPDEAVQLVGRDRFFDTTTEPKYRRDLKGGLQTYFGFSRSVRTSESGLYLQLNTSATPFYRRMTVAKIIGEWKHRHESEAPLLKHFIRGIRVQAQYGSRLCYRVHGISRADNGGEDSSPDNVSFDYHGRVTSVRNYLATEYPNDPRAISDPNNPQLVINCGSIDYPTHIPADLLDVCEGNVFRRLLDAEQTTSMVDFATRRPEINKANINDAGKQMFAVGSSGTDDPNNRFGLNLLASMQDLEGRCLPRPSLKYQFIQDKPQPGRTSRYIEISFEPPDTGEWNLTKFRFPSVTKAPKWTIIELHEGDPVSQAEYNKFVKLLRGAMTAYYSNGPTKPTYIALTRESTTLESPKSAKVVELLKWIKTDVRAHLVFVILPNKSARTYSLLKQAADVEVGIHTICVVSNHDTGQHRGQVREFKENAGFFANLMMKVNLKMGGANNVLHLQGQADVNALLSEQTIILGADVTHPGPGSMQDCDSVAAVVGTIDKHFNSYVATFSRQEGKKEMIDRFGIMLEERIRHWRRKNQQIDPAKKGKLPAQVIVVRDGVSEGQYSQVILTEEKAIREAFDRLYGPRKDHPKLLLMCVVKRVNTRFFPKTGNPSPGLIVDHTITYERGTDFYLQSQRALQGTAKPAHYVVLVNEITDDLNALQKMIYWQCFTLPRCTKPISVHPAARAADLACDRARVYLREYFVAGEQEDQSFEAVKSGAWNGRVHRDLEETMFYI